MFIEHTGRFYFYSLSTQDPSLFLVRTVWYLYIWYHTVRIQNGLSPCALAHVLSIYIEYIGRSYLFSLRTQGEPTFINWANRQFLLLLIDDTQRSYFCWPKLQGESTFLTLTTHKNLTSVHKEHEKILPLLTGNTGKYYLYSFGTCTQDCPSSVHQGHR